MNPYFFEVFTYTGYEWAIALLLVMEAIKLFMKKRYIVSCIILFLTISVYQSYVEVFLIILTAYIYIHIEEIQNAVKEYTKMLIVAGIPAGMNIFMV